MDINNNLFALAAQKKYRFDSPKGQLDVERLFEQPLTTAIEGKTSLNNIAISLDEALEKLGKKSFVETASDSPARVELSNKLEIVKAIIGVKQAENKAALDAREKQAKLQALYSALDAAQARELGAATPEELRKQIAALAGA